MKKYRNVLRCAVCGQVMATNKFGDGITSPLTTCLECTQKNTDGVVAEKIAQKERAANEKGA